MRQTLLPILLMLTLAVSAQEQKKFSPQQFQADLEQYITKEAQLTSEEAARFFPVFREMQEKQRAQSKLLMNPRKERPSDEAAYRKAIEQRDVAELEQKKIQQQYHQRFFRLLSAKKVYDVLHAEDRFLRQAFRNWGKGHNGERPHRSQ